MSDSEQLQVLVAVDLSAATKSIFDAVRRFSPLKDARICLLHVADPDPDFLGYAPGPQTVRDQVANEMRREHRQLETIATSWRDAGLATTPLQVQGPIADTILAEARRLNAAMIIVGSHGHGAVFQLLVGSVSEQILQHADCPVLVIPTHQRHD
jgi:nucleotide-binding universal stress UspA family protein